MVTMKGGTFNSMLDGHGGGGVCVIKDQDEEMKGNIAQSFLHFIFMRVVVMADGTTLLYLEHSTAGL